MKRIIYLLIISIALICCNNKDGKRHKNSDEVEAYKIDLRESESEKEKSAFEDGVYTATVDYYNPGTGYSATYTLNVEVEDNQVTIIYFPNGGYLDSSHIWPGELDEDGYVSIDAENGKAYNIQIDH